MDFIVGNKTGNTLKQDIDIVFCDFIHVQPLYLVFLLLVILSRNATSLCHNNQISGTVFGTPFFQNTKHDIEN